MKHTKSQDEQTKELKLIRLNQELTIEQTNLKESRRGEWFVFVCTLIVWLLSMILFGYYNGLAFGLVIALGFYLVYRHKAQPHRQRIKQIKQEINRVEFECPPFDDED